MTVSLDNTQRQPQVSVPLPAGAARQHTIDLARQTVSTAWDTHGFATGRMRGVDNLQQRVEELRVQDPKSYRRKQIWKAVGLGVYSVAATILGLAMITAPVVALAMLCSAGGAPGIIAGVSFAALLGLGSGLATLEGARAAVSRAVQNFKDRNLQQVIERTEARRNVKFEAVRQAQAQIQTQITALEQWQTSLQQVGVELNDVVLRGGITGQQVLDNLNAFNSRIEAFAQRVGEAS